MFISVFLVWAILLFLVLFIMHVQVLKYKSELVIPKHDGITMERASNKTKLWVQVACNCL